MLPAITEAAIRHSLSPSDTAYGEYATFAIVDFAGSPIFSRIDTQEASGYTSSRAGEHPSRAS